MGVPRDLQGWFKKASRVSERSSKGVSREFQGSFKDVFRKFQGGFKRVSRMFQENFKIKEFPGYFKNVSMVFCFAILLLDGYHRSYPRRRRACFLIK